MTLLRKVIWVFVFVIYGVVLFGLRFTATVLIFYR